MVSLSSRACTGSGPRAETTTTLGAAARASTASQGTPNSSPPTTRRSPDRQPPDTGRFRSLVTLYKASADYQKLADSTKRNWGPWLDRIADHFGELRIAQFDPPRRSGRSYGGGAPHIAEKPRAADYGCRCSRGCCSYAVDPLGKLASNPCEGIKQIYRSVRSEIIWTEADIAS